LLSFAGQALIQPGNRTVRMRTKGSLRKKLALLLIVAVVAATTETGPWRDSQHNHPSSNFAPLPARFLTPTQAVMDFDGDRLPDRAELIPNGSYKSIHLTLSSPKVTNLSFFTESPQPGSLYAEDIDRDGDNDLIWVSNQQPTQAELWLNNGTGDLARVADTSAYITEIKRLVADESHGGLFASSADEQLLATGTSEYSLLRRSDNSLPVAPHSITIPGSGRNCAAELSPCITRYPKRGPPAELS
jgi:hypothetical protein